MTKTQLEAIISELVSNKAYGWEFIIDEGVYASTRDYTFEITAMGTVDTLVGTNKANGMKLYIDINSIKMVKQYYAPSLHPPRVSEF